MQSRISPNLALLKPLMSIPPQLLEVGCAHSSPTHPTTIFSSMLVLGTITSTPSKRRNVYATDGENDHSGTVEPNGVQVSPDIDTPSDDFTRSTKPNMANNHLHPYLGFRRIITESQPLLLLRSHIRFMMVQFMFLLKCINSSVLRLLLPSRNIILRPPTSLPRKEVFMSLILLIMNHPHQMIPLLRTNQTLSSLKMHLKMRLTQS